MNKIGQIDMRAVITVIIILFLAALTYIVAVIQFQTSQPLWVEKLPAQKHFFDNLENILKTSDFLTPVIFVGASMFFIFSSFNIRNNIQLWFVSLLVFIFVVITVAYPIREVYNALHNASVMDVAMDELPLTNNLMLNLPFFISAVLAIAVIVAFSGVALT